MKQQLSNRKWNSAFMIYLVISLSFMVSMNADTVRGEDRIKHKVLQSTGDLVLSIPLMEVPGRSGHSFPIDLTYVGGAGIPVEMSSSWVGLGWNLDVGSINRQVIGLPDDMLSDIGQKSMRNVFFALYQDINDNTPWYKKLPNLLPQVFIFYMSLVSGDLFNSMNYIGQIIGWLYWQGVSYEMNGGNGVFLSWESVASFFGPTLLQEGLHVPASVVQTLMDVYGSAGYFRSVLAISGYLTGGTGFYFTQRNSPHHQNGYLYEPHKFEEFDKNGPLMSDGGKPDIYTISGPGIGGDLVIGNRDGDGQHVDQLDAKFYLKNTPALHTVDIEFYSQIEHCDDYSLRFTPYPLDEGARKIMCKGMSGDIDMFVVTLNDGTKLVYGDPSVQNSVERVYKHVQISRMNKNEEYWPEDSFTSMDLQVKLRLLKVIHQQYPEKWKLTAILNSDYVDGGSVKDLNPLNSEGANKGSWVAFEYANSLEWPGYDPSHSYLQNERTRIGYNYGSTGNNAYKSVDQGWKSYSGGVKSASHLSAIHTPLYKAVFEVSNRLDSKHVPPFTIYPTQEDCETDIFEHQEVLLYYPFGHDVDSRCSSQRDVRMDYLDQETKSDVFLKKLDRIKLYNKLNLQEPEQVIVFNKGISEDLQYALRPNSPNSVNTKFKGAYTLHRIDSCNSDESDCFPLAKFDYGYQTDGACDDQVQEMILVNLNNVIKTGMGATNRLVGSWPLSQLGVTCDNPELGFTMNLDSSERSKWGHGAYGWIEILDEQDNVVYLSGAKLSTSSDIRFNFNAAGYDVNKLKLNVWAYKCGNYANKEHHFRSCWGKATSSDDIRLNYLKVERLPSTGWENPSFNKNSQDAFGMYWIPGGTLQRNGANLYDSIFSGHGYDLADAWVLKKISLPTGASISWDYEVDNWFTSRGDVMQPLYGKYVNYYSYFRHRSDDPDTKTALCEANYGGGLRVVNESRCDGFGTCTSVSYTYTINDPVLGCERTSGTIDTVPWTQPTYYDAIDIRRRGHQASEYGTGSVLYNQVTKTYDGLDNYEVYKYFTVDSTPENTDRATDINMMDDFGGEPTQDFNKFGSFAGTPQPWKRGQEYWIGYYSTNTSVGKNGLLREVSRKMSSKEHFRYYFGDIEINAIHPLQGGLETKDFSGTQVYGASSGSMRVDEVNLRVYDLATDQSLDKTLLFSYDPYSGLPVETKTVGGGKTHISRVQYAHSVYPDMRELNMLTQPYETITYETDASNGHAVYAAMTLYKDFDSAEAIPEEGT